MSSGLDAEPQKRLPGAQRSVLVRNAFSILASDVANRAATFVVYVLVGRFLGAHDFGRLSLALTLFYVFQVVAAAGLKTYVTRGVAKDTAATGEYLVHATAVATAFSLLAIAAMEVFAITSYPSETARPILLLAFGLLPAALAAVCEGVLQGREQMHYIVWANAPVNVAKVGFAFLILATDRGLYSLIGVLLASYVAIAVVEWLVVLRLIIVEPRGRFDLRLAVRTARHTSTFLGIDALVAVVASLNIILLSQLESERTIGLYSAAAQLLVPLVLVYQNSILSTFPLMTRRAQSGRQRLTSVVERTGEVVVAIGLPVVIPLFFLAEPTLSLLYGDDFRPAADALRVMLWALLLSGLTATFGQVLYAGLAEAVNLRLVATAAVVGLVAGLVLITRYGLIGAAVSLLIVRVVDFTLHYLAASKLLPRLRLWPMIWKPLAAAACTAAYLAAVRPEGVLALASATAVYAAALVTIATWSVGGLRELKARYLYVSAD